MKLGNITFDCTDVLRVRVSGPPYSNAHSTIGATNTSRPSAVPTERAEPAWYFARVPEAKQAKNRVHLDLTTPDPDAVPLLVSLGAAVIGEHEVPGGSHRWTVMRDPEGNEFCVAAKSFTGWT